MKLWILKQFHKIFECLKPYPDFSESEPEEDTLKQWSKCWSCPVCGKQWRALLTGVDCAAPGTGEVYYEWYEYPKRELLLKEIMNGSENPNSQT